MRKYSSRASAPERVSFGREAIEGLKFFAETAHLAEPFEIVTEQLEKIHLERKRIERMLVPIRARVRFTNYAFDGAVRSAAKTAEIADGGKRGAVFDALFPNGMSAVVIPSGAGQVKPGRSFVTRLTESKAPGADAVRDEWLGPLNDALGGHEDALEARKGAYAELAQARAVEDAAKEDHELAVERLMGRIRAIFPKDKDRWDVIIPKGSRRSSASDDEPTVEEPTL